MDNNNNLELLLIDLQYFPCINYIKILSSFSNTTIFLWDSYKKMSFRNRCIVAGSNGTVNLSVPIEKGRNQRLPYREVKISYRDNWQQQHWRTIVSCYARSPWFEYYAHSLERILDTRFEYLFQLNLEILEWLCKLLKMEKPVLLEQEQALGQNFIDKRDLFLPNNYKSFSYIRYPQLFEDRIGFQPNLSILDMLFMEGPATAQILGNFNNRD
ncbi:WbqC family protein [Foetidibacter luteolus]|uniref:WbqC family protein n=1 Tax=Foetidibacter luteolus TaxID=2608880 RepID=UPI00129A0F52|nr:WbqC family protein [Foetidibacter luteolus]